MVPLPEDELSFVLAAERQLAPDLRAVFVERVARSLGAHPSPGRGDVDRAVRQALDGLWVPPVLERKGPRWARPTPSFERVSRAAKLPPELPPD
jgi:hypothetical protein